MENVEPIKEPEPRTVEQIKSDMFDMIVSKEQFENQWRSRMQQLQGELESVMD